MFIEKLQELVGDAREILSDFEREQNDDSDTGNADHILGATAALDAFEGHVGDLVP